MRTRVLALDTETTGFSPERDRIVEFAAIEVEPRSGQCGSYVHRLVNPLRRIPASVSAVHGITDAKVRDRAPFREIADDVVAFLDGATLAIHNSSFDVKMLDAELQRAGKQPLRNMDVEVVDSVELARSIYPFLGRHSLDALCDHLRIGREDRVFHGALLDVRLLSSTFPRMAADFDAWESTSEEPVSDDLETFERELLRLVESLVATRPLSAAACDIALAEVATGMRWTGATKTMLIDRLAEVISDGPWACKHFAARWRESEHVSWKAAADAMLPEFDFAPYTSTMKSSTLVPRTSPRIGRRLEALAAIVEAHAVASSPHCLARAIHALKGVEKTLAAFRETLHEDLISAIATGYVPAHATFRESTRVTVDYRGAVHDRAGDADLRAYTSTSRSLRIIERDVDRCRKFFRG